MSDGVAYTTLIDATTLAGRLDDANWRIFDCRHQLADPAAGERAYLAGHLPGARFLHLDRDLSGPRPGRLCGGRHPLTEPAGLLARLAAAGVTPRTQVVAYDDAGGMIAARLWWLLRWLGHAAVAVLDGGLPAWQQAGLPLTTEMPADTAPGTRVAPAPEAAAPGPRSRCVALDEVIAGLGSPGRVIVDARSPDRYRGENETLDPVGGHIPGAVNRFFRDNLDADGRFKPASQLRSEWTALLAGLPPAAVVHQCGSGVSACVNILAMEVAGLSGSRLYAGSWSEWCADPARPVAVGPG